MKGPSWALAALAITVHYYSLVYSSPAPFFSQIQPCPASCSVVGADPTNWTVYNDVERLSQCSEPLVFDFNIFASLELLSSQTTVRACTAGDGTSSSQRTLDTTSCGPSKSTSATVAIVSWGSPTPENSSSVIAATKSSQRQLRAKSTCGTTIMFAFSGETIVGLYGGSKIMGGRTVDSVTNLLVSQAQAPGIGSSLAAQLCGEGRDGEHTLGAVVSTRGDFAFVQATMQQWANASCVTGSDQSTSSSIAIAQRPLSSPLPPRRRSIVSRSACSFVQVVSGDSCASLASKCGISASQFTSFNPSSTLDRKSVV